MFCAFYLQERKRLICFQRRASHPIYHLFDFVLVPVWYGFNRPEISGFIATMNTMDNTQLQMELMRKMTDHHDPYTLMGGGLFHLSFGAILTGSVLNRK